MHGILFIVRVSFRSRSTEVVATGRSDWQIRAKSEELTRSSCIHGRMSVI